MISNNPNLSQNDFSMNKLNRNHIVMNVTNQSNAQALMLDVITPFPLGESKVKQTKRNSPPKIQLKKRRILT